jgi:hypothetical protein
VDFTLVTVTKMLVSERDKKDVFDFLLYVDKSILPFERDCGCWLFIYKKDFKIGFTIFLIHPLFPT